MDVTAASAEPTGLSQQAAEPEVSALTGFDPSRTTLREWVAQRHEYLRFELRRITHELREIGAVARALNLAVPDSQRAYGRSPNGTIKSAALASLAVSPGGMTSAELRPIIEAALNRQFTRQSIAPQLSRLKAAGLLSWENGRWFPTASGMEAAMIDAAPEGEPA
jgi:hypothetical protein